MTFTLDASGKITVSVAKNFVTPIGIFSVETGVEHQFDINPKGFLTAVFRYLDPERGLVEAGYQIKTDRRVEPALDGQELAPAQGGTLRIDATDAEPGETTELTISDTPQDTPVPSASASACGDSGSVELELPEVSAGDAVADTVAELSAACLEVQYAVEEVTEPEDGTVVRVEIPTTGPEGKVQLPPVDDGAPGPGDKVTASRAQAATVHVAATPQEPSPTDTATSPPPTETAPTAPTDSPPPGTTTVHGAAYAPVRSDPSRTGIEVSNIDAGFDYDALCAQRGEEVTAHGRTSDIWIKLLRTNGETGWVTATALTGDPETVVTTAC
ncbi:hypothetical protein AB0I98_10515 [Streptomyces sp. NPDC050211]|uniref:hypothetical protein n=1 Tax=Streptomyces sp. NPDC050211 TaxID=3154932 RepID=UPI00343A6058